MLLLQDLVLPPMFSPHKYSQSPLLGGAPRERHIFAFFKGRLLNNVPKYSRGLRQFLDKYCSESLKPCHRKGAAVDPDACRWHECRGERLVGQAQNIHRRSNSSRGVRLLLAAPRKLHLLFRYHGRRLLVSL